MNDLYLQAVLVYLENAIGFDYVLKQNIILLIHYKIMTNLKTMKIHLSLFSRKPVFV